MQTMKRASLLALLGLVTVGSPRAAQAAACASSWTGAAGGNLVSTIEAETGTTSGTMANRADAAASGGTYVGGTSGNDNTTVDTSCTGSNRGCDTISFTPGTTGNYKIGARVKAADGSNNSFMFFISGVNDCNGQSVQPWKINTTGSSYNDFYVTDDSSSDQTDTAGNARVYYLSAGTAYNLVFRVREGGTRLDRVYLYLDPADAAAPTNTPTPSNTYTPVPASGTGLCGSYYSNTNLTGTATGTTTTGVSYSWLTGSPTGMGLPSVDGFSARYSGQIQFPWPGNYQITVGSDDGSRVYLGCITCPAYIGLTYTALNSWIDQSYTEYTGASIAVTGGAKYNIVVDFYERTGDAQIQLKWSNDNALAGTPVVVPQNRLYNTGPCNPTNTSTPSTPVPTPTNTPTPVPVWMGIPPAERLYGLEYIPFPNVSSSSTFNDLSYPSGTAAGNDVGKNTARYRVVIQNAPFSPLQVETRIGPYGVTCTTGYWNINDYAADTELTLPDRPQNLSTTYAWLVDPTDPTTQVPITERYDVMGDPRYVPYADMLSLPAGQPFANNYNWFFKNMGDSTKADYQAEYAPFLTEADWNLYNGGPNSDVPRQMMLWREGIAKSFSIYTSMTGFSNYYIGIGGEIGGDSANKLPSSVVAFDGPWSSGSVTTNSGHNEITGSTTLVRMTGTASATAGWISKPWIGELWPDVAYASDWASPAGLGVTYTTNATWGNLKNPSYSSGGFYRTAWDSADVASLQTFDNVRHITADPGCATFMNGNGSSGNFGHSYNDGYVATWLNDAQVTARDYNVSIPGTFAVARPFGLNRSNTPPESGRAPYSTNRFTLDMYTASTQTATNTGFYEWGGLADQRSSAAVRGRWNGNIGWYIVNGLAPSTDSGINFVARFALLSCVRTFQEAGAPDAGEGVFNGKTAKTTLNTAGRIQPIPSVKITDPKVNQDLSGYPSVAISWNKRYVRWDMARYTENYPCIDDYDSAGGCAPANPTAKGNPNLEWHSLTGTALVFNLKYSLDNGNNWKSCLTDAPASPGIYMDTVDSIPGSASNTYSYTWDVSAIAPGTKLLRVECYRANVPQHYAYHEIALKTAP